MSKCQLRYGTFEKARGSTFQAVLSVLEQVCILTLRWPYLGNERRQSLGDASSALGVLELCGVEPVSKPVGGSVFEIHTCVAYMLSSVARFHSKFLSVTGGEQLCPRAC